MSRPRIPPILFLLPAIGIVALISFYPLYYAVDISLHDTRYFQKQAFVGLRHYLGLPGDPEFLRALSTSVKYVVCSLAITLPVGMVLALVLNRPLRFRKAFRTI